MGAKQVLSPKKLFTLDGATDIATVGLTANLEVHWLNNDNTIARNLSGDATGWHRIDCNGAKTLTIYGSSRVVAKGTLTASLIQQIRPVALGVPIDLGHDPIAVGVTPADFADDDLYEDLQMEIWPFNVEEGVQRRTSFLSGETEAALQGIVPSLAAMADDATVHFRFQISDRTVGAKLANEAIGSGRHEKPHVYNTDLVYLALGMNVAGFTGALGTTFIESKIVAITRE